MRGGNEMNSERFSAILSLKVSGLVECLIHAVGLSLEDAIRRVYCSKLYQALEREETKLWHHSPQLLCDCLMAEAETGLPALPDE